MAAEVSANVRNSRKRPYLPGLLSLQKAAEGVSPDNWKLLFFAGPSVVARSALVDGERSLIQINYVRDRT